MLSSSRWRLLLIGVMILVVGCGKTGEETSASRRTAENGSTTDSSSLADDQNDQAPMPVVVDTTEQSESAPADEVNAGLSTAVMPDDATDHVLPTSPSEATVSEDAATPSLTGRTWNDEACNQRFVAELVQCRAGWVQLRKPDGTLIAIEVDRLCREDQEFIYEWQEARETMPIPETADPPKPEEQPLPKEFLNSIEMEMKQVPIEGSTELEKPFHLSITEVTQGQWQAVMGTKPWGHASDVRDGDQFPAVYVSWNDAVEFCRKLSEKEGKTYRLPTVAEWEYACTAGADTPYCFGEDKAALAEYAWFGARLGDGPCKEEKYAHRVGCKKPNAWGLYDMHGNVVEWCQDVYTADHFRGEGRAARGGSWFEQADRCHATYPYGQLPDQKSGFLGFRVVLESDE